MASTSKAGVNYNDQLSDEGPQVEVHQDDEERLNFQRVVNTFQLYSHHSAIRLNKAYRCLEKLPQRHQSLLRDYKGHLDKIKISILHNHEVLRRLVDYDDNTFDSLQPCFNTSESTGPSGSSSELRMIIASMLSEPRLKPTSIDIEKVQSVLKQIVREWSSEGQVERDQSFKLILDALEQYLCQSVGEKTRGQTKVLVPGAGLGRLPYEIVKKGYSCQGNEYSLFMLLPSNFILNQCTEPNLFRIYPFVHQYGNNLTCHDQIRPISFPDISPNDIILSDCQFSMAAGNFLEIYTETEWDCVCTCFFLDTAHNVVEYIEKIHSILNDNGLWINFGPLLYHYADIGDECSIEPSYDILSSIITKCGFEYLEEKLNIDSFYVKNALSMMSSPIYRCAFFVCRKITATI